MAVNQDYTALRERYQQRQAERQQARTSHTEALKNAFMQRQAQRGITNTQNSQSGAFDIDSRKMGFLQRQLQRGNITEEQVLEQVYKPYKDFINQVNGVISGYEQFANNYNTRFGGRKYDMSDAYMGDSQQYLDEVTAYNQQLIAQSNAILATLEANPDAFDKETAEEIKRAMTMAQENAAAILKVAGEDNTYWNSWGNGAIDHEQELEEMQLLLAEWDATGALRNSVEQGLPLNDEQQERYNRLVAAMEPYGGAREVLENAIAEKQKFLDENPDWRNATTAESMYLQAQQDQSYADKYNGVSGVKLLDVINFLDEGAEKEWVTGQALRTMAFDEAQAVVETMEQEFRELSQTGTLRNAYASGMALTPEEEAAAKAAIAQYESVLKKYGIDTKGEDAEPMEAFSKLIQQRKTLVAESKKTQEYVRLSAVQENKDFAKYVEKGKAEAIEYAEKNKKTDHMTNKEIDVLAYYIGKDKENGTNTADTYKAAIKHYLKHRRAQEIADNINGMDIPVIEGLTRIGYSYIADMVRFGRGIVQNFNFGDEAIGPTVFELGSNYAGAGKDLNWFDRTAHKVAGVMGYMTPALLTAKLTGGATGIASLGKAAGSALMFLGSAGEAYGEALDKGYDKPAARAYSALVGLSEVTLQNVLGGISEFGGLPAMLEGKIAAIKKVLLRTAAKYGVSIVGEEIEENLQNFLEPAIRTMVLGEEYDMPTMQEVFDTIITTALSTSGMEGPGIVKESIKDAKVDKLLGENINEHSFLTPRERVVVNTITDKLVAEAEQGGKKLSADEKQKIYDQVVDDMDTGRIDIQQIEEAIGKGDQYKQLVSEFEELKELNKLDPTEMTGEQSARLAELEAKNQENNYEKAIKSYDKAFSQAVEGLVKSDRLAESYRERDRRREAYKVEDLSQYSEAQQQTIRDAMNSGILNNTRRTHEFVDFIAKVSDKLGVKFNFTDNKRLRESGFAMEGVTVNGFVNKDGITVNVNSAKALNSVVGHEITNILEGTDLYESLAMAITEYARKKGEYESRMQQIRDLYEGKEGYTGENAEAKLEAELVADLVGDYIFTDKQFVEKLFNEDRGLFNWIRKQINYLHSLATAGSKEARLLEKSKKMFAEVVNEAKQDVNRKSLADSDGDLFSLSNDKKRDATYIDAVNRGDKQAAKEMVDEYSISAPGQTKTTGGGWNVRGRDISLPMPEETTVETDQEKTEVNLSEDDVLDELLQEEIYQLDQREKKKEALQRRLEATQNLQNHLGEELQRAKEKYAKHKNKNSGSARNLLKKLIRLSYLSQNPTVLSDQIRNIQNQIEDLDEKIGEAAPTAEDFQESTVAGTEAEQAKPVNLPGLEKNQPQSQGEAQSGVLPMPKQTPKDQQTEAREALHEALFGKQQTGTKTKPAQQTTQQETADLDAEYRRQMGDDSSYYDPAEGEEIETARERLEVQRNNLQIELRENQRLRQEVIEEFDQKIADKQARYDAKQHKESKTSQALLRSIERDKRLKADRLAEFDRAIARNESRIGILDEKLATNKPEKQDRLEKAYERIDKDRDAAELELIKQYDAKKAEISKGLDNKEQWIKNKAFDVLWEMGEWVKGEKPSQTLGRIWDIRVDGQRLEWNDIKHALADIKDGTRVQKSYAEDAIMEVLERTYQDRVTELAALEESFNRDVEKLNKEAEEKKKKAQIANIKKEVRARYLYEAAKLAGDVSGWKDKNTGFAAKINTLRRNLFDVVRNKDGTPNWERAAAIDEWLNGNYNHNEALLKKEASELFEKYRKLNINKEESAYIQMLGEFLQGTNDKIKTNVSAAMLEAFRKEYGDKINEEKCRKVVDMARQDYDTLFERVNEVLRANGMTELPYVKGYFPHMQEIQQNWIQKILNIKSVEHQEKPTEVAGISGAFKPNKKSQGYSKERKGPETEFNFLKGYQQYVAGVLDWIHHIPDIQRRRALENFIRITHAQDNETIMRRVKEIQESDEFDANEEQEELNKLFEGKTNPLGNFVTDLMIGTNSLAGKKTSGDRLVEDFLNPDVNQVINQISSRVSANLVAGSFSAGLSNIAAIPLSWGGVSPISTLAEIGHAFKNTFDRWDDGLVAKSDFLTNRLRNPEKLYKETWDHIGEAVSWWGSWTDNFVTQVIWRSRYRENMKSGMTETQAIKDADIFAESVLAGRSRGNMPTLFESRNFIAKAFTTCQLEVNNQYGYLLKDMPRDQQVRAKNKLVAGFMKVFIGSHMINQLFFMPVTGRRVAFDPITIISQLLMGLIDDEEENDKAILRFAEDVLQEIPLVGGLMGGGRVPVSSALPYDDIQSLLTEMPQDMVNGDWKNVGKEWLNPLYYLGLPMAGGQIKKTNEAISLYKDGFKMQWRDEPGSYTDDGRLKYTVSSNPASVLQKLLFGKWAGQNAQQYIEEGRSPLSQKQTQEFFDLGVSIEEYWEIQDGLKELNRESESGRASINEVGDYIGELDLTTQQKNILINNYAQRKEPIDMTDYDNYDSFEEFDYATQKPGKYAVSQAVGGYEQYKSFKNTFDSFGSKEKLVKYINKMQIPYGAKIILFVDKYKTKENREKYGADIVEYLNGRKDISREQMIQILEELGFKVSKDGKVSY